MPPTGAALALQRGRVRMRSAGWGGQLELPSWEGLEPLPLSAKPLPLLLCEFLGEGGHLAFLLTALPSEDNGAFPDGT